MVLRTLTNAGQPLRYPDGTPAARVKVTFTLVDNHGNLTDAWDTVDMIRISPLTLMATTDATGVFSINLWPTARADRPVYYLCKVPILGTIDIVAPLPDNSGAYMWSQFKTGYSGDPANYAAAPIQILDASSPYPNLAAALGDLSTYGKTVWISTAVSCNDLTVTHREVRVLMGGMITVNTGHILTLGAFDAGRYQCFAGAGTVTFTSGLTDSVFPEWWGALADDTTDSADAINAAIVAHRVVRFAWGSYRISKMLRVDAVDGSNYPTQQGQCLLGAGSTEGSGLATSGRIAGTMIKPIVNPGVTRLKYMLKIGDDTMQSFTYVAGLRVCGIHFFGSYAGQNEQTRLKDTRYGIMMRRVADYSITNCKFTDMEWGIYSYGRYDSNVNNWVTNFNGVIADNVFEYILIAGIKLMFGSAEIHISRNFMQFFGSGFYPVQTVYGVLSVGQTLGNMLHDNYIQYMGYTGFPSSADGSDGFKHQRGYGIGLYSGAATWGISGGYYEKNDYDIYFGSNVELNPANEAYDYWDTVDLGVNVGVFPTDSLGNYIGRGGSFSFGAASIKFNARAKNNTVDSVHFENKIRTYYPLYSSRVSYGGAVYYCKNDVLSATNPLADSTNWGTCAVNEPWFLAAQVPAWVSGAQYRSGKSRTYTYAGTFVKPDWTGIVGEGSITTTGDVSNTLKGNYYFNLGGIYDSIPNPTYYPLGDYLTADVQTLGSLQAAGTVRGDKGLNVNQITYMEGLGGGFEQSVSFGAYFNRGDAQYHFASANAYVAGVRHEPSNKRIYLFAGGTGSNAKDATAAISNFFGMDYSDLSNPYLVFNGIKVFSGTGVPAITAPKGSLFLRRDGAAGSTFYVNESGSTTWAAK